MTMNRAYIMTLLIILTVAPVATALEQEGGARFLVADPTGGFGDNVEDAAFGLELHYGLRPCPRVTFGLGLNAMTYGSESRRYSHPLVEDYEVETSNNLAGGFLFAQWRPLTGAVQPYLEGRVGLNYLWTESSIKDEDWWDDDDVARQTNYDDWATYWGGGGGMLFRLKEGDPRENKLGVYLDAKVTYQKGAQAEYLAEGDVSIENDRPVFDVSRSSTDLVAYELGVVLTF
jgi:hypothetical protein